MQDDVVRAGVQAIGAGGIQAGGIQGGAPRHALELLGVILHWLLVPVEAGLALWGMLLLLAVAGWAAYLAVWFIRRSTSGLRSASPGMSRVMNEDPPQR